MRKQEDIVWSASGTIVFCRWYNYKFTFLYAMDLVNVTSGSAGWISFDAGKARNIFKDISF